MRQIPLSRSLLHYLDRLDSSEASLSADPDAQHLAPAFQQCITDWTPVFNKEREGRRNVVRSQAVVNVTNSRLDIFTINFVNVAKGVAAFLLEQWIKVAPSRFIKAPLRKQAETTLSFIVPEVAKLPSDHILASYGVELGVRAGAAITALNNRSKAMGANGGIRNEVLEYKEGVNTLRTNTYADLLKLAKAKGYPRSWVEAFFAWDESKGDDADDDEEEGESASTGGSPATP